MIDEIVDAQYYRTWGSVSLASGYVEKPISSSRSDQPII